MKNLKRNFYKFFNKSLMRFVSVGIIGELLYLFLFATFSYLAFKSTFSVLASGLICILFNSYMHAKFSFKINYNFKFLIQYIFIQLICLLSTYILSFLFVWLGMSKLALALSTLIIWGTFSFLIMSNIASFEKRK